MGVPLTFRLELTAEQQRQILEQTGQTLTSLPYESSALAVRIPFGGITLDVPRGVFVPTDSTERLLEAGLEAAAQWREPTIVDVGTGCGAVALAAARALPAAMVFATDISKPALHAARKNRTRLGLGNVRFAQGSLLRPLPRRLHGRVAVIFANVPYVPPHMSNALASAFPVGTAIGLGPDGLGLVRELADAARAFLAPGGSLVLQLADFQWPVISEELTRLGYSAPGLSTRVHPGPVAGRLVWTRGSGSVDSSADLRSPSSH